MFVFLSYACVMLMHVYLCACRIFTPIQYFLSWPWAYKRNARGDSSGDTMRRTLHVSLIVFPLRSIIKKCVDQTRGSYQIRPGKANYTDNNLSLYCWRHVLPYKATNTWNMTGNGGVCGGHWVEMGHLNCSIFVYTSPVESQYLWGWFVVVFE